MSLFKFGFTTRAKSGAEFREEHEELKEGGLRESSVTLQPGPSSRTSAGSSKSDVKLISEAESNAGLLDLGSKDSGPKQPILASFPQVKTGGKNPSFNKDWYNRFTWLEYSVFSDAVFCYSCRIFPSISSHKEHNFIEIGINQWKKAIKKFRGHSKSESHKTSFSRWRHDLQSLRELGSIVSKISGQYSRVVKETGHT